jgi:hypothetical protein
MTFSPGVHVRPRLGLLEIWFFAETAGNWESEPTVPGSDARLGDGDWLSAIFGHAHGAQILESHWWAELQSLECALKLRQPDERLRANRQFCAQRFPQTVLEKVK